MLEYAGNKEELIALNVPEVCSWCNLCTYTNNYADCVYELYKK